MKIILLLLFTSTTIFAESIDTELASYIKRFNLRAVKAPKDRNNDKFELGKRLFFDKNLSGNKDVSCATCHDAKFGSGDGLPLSIGVTGRGIGSKRIANGAPIISRHAPHLHNLKNKAFMFWDGRVSFDGFEYVTPEPGLNGEYPKYKEIVEALDGALAAQALFPPTNTEEMRGKNNEFSDAKTNIEIWKRIMERILSLPRYKEMFEKAFPSTQDFNIGHLGSAIAHFEGHEFNVSNTPWDQYLRGDMEALSKIEKQGAIIFLDKGKCVNCHSGSDFGGSTFRNIAAPQIGPGKDIHHNDEGRFLITKNKRDQYKFKTPVLKNISKSAPYFHTGAYETLSDVIDHYSKGINAIDSYSDRWLFDFEEYNYGDKLFVERNPYRVFRKKENAHPLIRKNKISLTNPEKKKLLKFLEKSLTE